MKLIDGNCSLIKDEKVAIKLVRGEQLDLYKNR